MTSREELTLKEVAEMEEIPLPIESWGRMPTPSEWGFFFYVQTRRRANKKLVEAIVEFQDSHLLPLEFEAMKTIYYKLFRFYVNSKNAKSII